MRNMSAKVSLCLGALLWAHQADAAELVFAAPLTGLEEVPIPVVTPGTGKARVTIDTVASTMRVQASFAQLLGTTTAAHIHCCQPVGVNAGVATAVPSFPGFPLGVNAGTMDQTFDMTLAGSYSPAFLTANGGTPAGAFAGLLSGLQAEDAYFNVHTTSFGGGEIRGQLVRVPEPATWLMLIAGFGIVGAAMRSGRRRVSLAYA